MVGRISAGWGGSVGICGAGSDGGIMDGVGWLMHSGSSDDGVGWELNEKRGPVKDGTLGSCPIRIFLSCNCCTTSRRLYIEVSRMILLWSNLHPE